MATRQQKNTITNIYRYRSTKELENNPSLYGKDEGGNIFNSKCLDDIVYQSQPPVDLWHGLWHQGEMACLFGEPNVGKTILAMRMAADIVKRGERILYFDFENAEHQLLPRYKGGKIPYIDILTLNHANPNIKHDNRSMLNYIKRATLLRQAHIIIIDDITHLFGTGNQDDVRYVLNTLRSWTKYLRISILVLAHSVKKKMNQLANIEQLAGSFECAYSFDSIFSLNRANDYNRRKRNISHYIKQHKTRMGAIRYDDSNVIALNMRFDDNTQSLTMCDLASGANERQLVRDYGYYTDQEILEAILDFKEKFYTIREIANMVGLSKSQVQRILAKNYTPHQPENKDTLTPLPPTSTEPLNPHSIDSSQILDEEDLLYDDGAQPSYLPYYPDDTWPQQNQDQTEPSESKAETPPLS